MCICVWGEDQKDWSYDIGFIFVGLSDFAISFDVNRDPVVERFSRRTGMQETL